VFDAAFHNGKGGEEVVVGAIIYRVAAYRGSAGRCEADGGAINYTLLPE